LFGFTRGDRTFNWIDKGHPLCFVDAKNNLKCDLRFNPDGISGISSLFSSPKTPADRVRGFITAHVPKDPKHPPKFCEVDGSWLDGLAFDGKLYWTMGQWAPFFPTAVEYNVLPSDSRFRADLVALKRALANNSAKADMEVAQRKKEELEILQRKDRHLRKVHTPAKYLADKKKH